MTSTVKILVDYGRMSDDNLNILKSTYTQLITDLLSNGGKEVASGNIGDLSFVYNSNKSMTTAEFAHILSEAIAIIEGKPTGFTRKLQIKFI